MAQVKRTKDGRWLLDFEDQFCNRRRIKLKPGTSKNDALQELAKHLEEVERGSFVSAKKVPTFEKVADTWLKHKKLQVGLDSWLNDERNVRLHLNKFSGLKITRITSPVLQEFMDERLEAGMHRNSLQKVKTTLNQVLNFAVLHRYLNTNPMGPVRIIAQRTEGETADNAMKVLNPQQIKGFVEAEKDPKYHCLFMLATFTGARQSELLGLKWQDIDWEHSQIRIERRFRSGRFGPPKTKRSRRRIDLGPKMIRELKAWKLACPPNDHDLLFPNGEGEPMNYSNMVQRHFQPALATACLPLIRFHDLRHTYASIQIHKGLDIVYISRQLGHSKPSVTIDIYGHLTKRVNSDAAADLEAEVFGC
jgi:integrase